VLPQGVFQYIPATHTLQPRSTADIRPELCHAALDQEFIQEAAAVIILTAVHQRTMVRYGERTTRYVLMEVGHATQNLLLQCTAIGLGAVPVGAFEDEAVSILLDLPNDVRLWYLIAVGYPATEA
jgi:SagB-type dehydrogenase family enzyme